MHGFVEPVISINAADNPHTGDVYLTVTGTSAEAGDDGEVGRGNRGNGLITPCRPMSLEAIAGKNPRTHVGKIYNVLATRIANAIIMRISDIREAHCLLVSEIGRPVNEPSLIRLSIDAPGHRAATFRKELAQIIDENLCRIAELTEAFVASNVPVF